MKFGFRSIPIDDWPWRDRETWALACQPSQRFLRGGAASHLKPVTRTSLIRAYGYLLDHCQRIGTLDLDAAPARHVNRESIECFLVELQDRVGSVTRYNYIARIHRLVTILAPETDWEWLKLIALDLQDAQRPRSKAARIVSAERLLNLGIDLMHRARQEQDATQLQHARLYRNGLIIAFLALYPIRLKNLASLTIGRQLRLIDGTWWLILGADETKTGRPDERPLHADFKPYIDEWLNTWRPLFVDPQDAVWASTKGGGLAYTYVGSIISETTRRELGVVVNPHLFRDCAVFTIAHNAGDRMGIASALLQHTDARVTNAHYNRGSTVLAVQQFHQVLRTFEE